MEKTAGLDASHSATVAAGKAKAKAMREEGTASVPRTATSGRVATGLDPLRTAATAASGGRQSVESLVAALAAEQSQRLNKVGRLPPPLIIFLAP